MESDTPQLGNAANSGDIIKHVSLVGLLRAFAPISGRLLYAETHAFRPQTELTEDRALAWVTGIDALPARSAAVQEYVELERAAVAGGRYLCSVGLAKTVLEARPAGRTDYVLCESGNESRRLLATAIPEATVLSDNAALEQTLGSRAGQFDAVLMHVDPYGLKESGPLFASWLRGALRATKAGAPVVALVFDYENEGWPEEPVPGLRLIGTTAQAPFFLAAYANDAGRGRSSATLAACRWQVALAP